MEDWLDFFNVYVMGSLQALIGFYFFAKCFPKKGKPIFYALFAVLGTAAIVLLPAGGVVQFAAYLLLLVAGGIFLCKAAFSTVILYAIVIVEIMQLNYGVLNAASGFLYPLLFSGHREIAGMACMALGGIALAMAVFCYGAVYRHFALAETVESKCALLILTPTLMICLVGGYISFAVYGSTITTGSDGSIANAGYCQLLVIQLLGIASLFCILHAYKKLVENFRLSTKLSLMGQEVHFLQQYVDEAKVRYERTKSFRHDIKNHVMVVKELLQSKKPEEALEYVSGMESLADELSFPCSTNHPVLDILLGNKLGMAKNDGIEVQCSLQLPYPCSINDMDFCIILSNALDNAICACRNMEESSEKYIHVTGSLQGDFILLEVENSFQGDASVCPGTGLGNIKSVVEKYHGAMELRTQGAVFGLSILLIISQQSESISQQTGSFAAFNSRKK